MLFEHHRNYNFTRSFTIICNNKLNASSRIWDKSATGEKVIPGNLDLDDKIQNFLTVQSSFELTIVYFA